MSYLDQITVGSTTYDLQDSGAQRETITGSGAPSTSTVGTVGLHYINTSATGHPYEYVCVGATGSTYTWIPIDSADAPVTSVNNKTGAVVLTASDVGAGTYSKPSGGIPKTDLASAVQTSLGKADTSYQKPSTGIPATDLAEGVIPSVPTAYTSDPEDLGTASPGTSNSWARGDHVHAKPTYSKSDVGLGNVDNIKQYSVSNPPPYPVTSVNGKTGAVSIAVPAASSTTPADLGTAAVGTGTTWARADHVHKMPSASDIGAVPSTTNIVNDVQYNSTQKAIRMSKNGSMSDVVTISELKSDMDLKTSDLTNDSGFVDATGAAAAAPVQSVNGQTGAVTIPEDDKTWNNYVLDTTNEITASSIKIPWLKSNTDSDKRFRLVDASSTPSQYYLAKYDIYAYLHSTTPSANDNSTKVATTAYVDNAIDNLPEPMVFKGSLGTGGTITTLPAASSSNTGFTYKVITNGTYASQSAKVGDTFISDGTAWILIPSGDEPSGTVTSVGVSNSTNGGLSISGSPITTSGTISIGHSNVLSSAQTTQAVYPIKIDKNGHISAYGSAVSIPSKTSDLTNDSGFVDSSEAAAAAPVQSVNGKTGAVTVSESDEKLKTTALGDSSAYVLLGPDSSTAGNKYYTTGMSFASRSDEYTARLTIGESGTGTSRRSGQLALYDQDKYCIVRKNSTTNSGYYVNLPESGGTLALKSEIPTKVSNLTNDSGFVNASGAADAAPVQSVNGKTGTVVLDADDVGALPNDYTPPVTSVNGKTGVVVVSKSDVGLTNVDNVQQYSADNPPPYPVTSVNGKTGAVTVSVPSAATATPANLGTAAVGTSTKWAKEDHVHKMPTASDVGALPSSTVIPAASSATPKALGTAAAGTSNDYSRADHVHAKPTYSKSDVGLGNVDNVKQYSASNPPPYPVTSVNGSTGAVTVSVPSASSTAPANLAATAAVGTGTTWARADHVHKMPSASDVGALPSSTVIPSAATATPSNLGTAAVGTSTKYAKEDHVHNYPDIVHVGSSAPADTNIELWLDNSSGGNSVVSSVDGKTGTVTVLPSGGTTGQVLKKVSGTNYDVTWANESGSVTSVDGKTGVVTVLPAGGAAGKVLKKKTSSDYDVEWSDESGGVTSVNGQTGDVEISTVAVQDSAPTGGELVWIDTDESGESITLPQIDDNNVSTDDTWSSSKIRDFIYPIGSIYMSVNSISPATIFGGTWEQIEDRFLLAAGTTYSAGDTGGSATNSHTHTMAHTHSLGSDGFAKMTIYTDGSRIAYREKANCPAWTTTFRTASTGSAAASYSASSTWGAELGGITGGSNSSSTGEASNTDNMPPYLVVYMWKRTA